MDTAVPVESLHQATEPGPVLAPVALEVTADRHGRDRPRARALECGRRALCGGAGRPRVVDEQDGGSVESPGGLELVGVEVVRGGGIAPADEEGLVAVPGRATELPDDPRQRLRFVALCGGGWHSRDE